MRANCSRSDRIPRAAAAWIPAYVLMLCAGCGETPSKVDSPAKMPPPASAPSNSNAANDTAEKSSPTTSRDATPQSLVRVDEKGQKWFGDIPYDVWFDDPLATAGDLSDAKKTGEKTDGANTATPPVAKAEPTKSEPSASPTETQPSAGASEVNWEQVAPVAVVDAEIKSIRNRLTQNMQTVGTYNGSYKDIQSDGSTIAALAAVAVVHPGAISWKERAPAIRDLGTQIATSSKALGRESYEATQKPFEQLVAVLDGERPANGATPEANVDFAVCANRGGLMLRLNRSFNWLKQNIGKEDELTAKADEAAHETSLIAALGAVVSNKSYESSQDEEYRTHAVGMIDSAQQARKAVDDKNFAEYQAAFNRVQQRCDQCHADYRFGNE